MFSHRQELQHQAKPDKPDAVYARKLQEVLGGQYGEIAMQYPTVAAIVGRTDPQHAIVAGAVKDALHRD